MCIRSIHIHIMSTIPKPINNMPDKIFYINLDRRPDRDQNIQQLFQQFNIQNISEKISAVDGSMLNLDNISQNIISEKGISDAKDKTKITGIPLTPGGIGCALSHRSAWQKIIDENLDTVLILEDDISIDKDFHSKLNTYMIQAKPLLYDVLFIGYHPASIKYILPNSTSSIFVRSSRTYGLFGYVVSKKGAKKLLNIFPIDLQIDTTMSNAIELHNLDMYLVKPENRIITSDPSEIAKKFGTDIQKRENFISQCSGFSVTSYSFFYHTIWVLTVIVGVYMICLFSGFITSHI